MTVSEQSYGLVMRMPNSGFVRELWLLRAGDVLAVLDPATLPLTGQPMTVHQGGVLVEVGAHVTHLVPPPRTAMFEEATVTDRAGIAYVPALELTLPKPDERLRDYLFRNQATRWVVFWRDYNDQGWIAGEADNGLRLTITSSQGSANGLRLSLTGRQMHPAWRLASTELTALFPAAEFDHSFDLSFDS